MSTQEFIGELKKIAPAKLVSGEKDEIGGFFLVLAVIYNDVKGIVYLNRIFGETFGPPPPSGITPHLGEYNGMTTQHFKLLAGTIDEFFRFLKEHEAIYTDPQFMLIMLKLPKDIRSQWQDVLDAALERETRKGGLGNKLMLIRNNVAFHYYQSEKVLRRSYGEFFSDKTQVGADHAYYSLGSTMQDTRFYYADAAVQRYLLKTASKEYQKDYAKDMESYRALQKETSELVRTMNMVLAHLLRQFILMRSSL
ncbi:MAG: hypothetical protein ACYC1Y_00010 [Minisyncoccota bacterium]